MKPAAPGSAIVEADWNPELAGQPPGLVVANRVAQLGDSELSLVDTPMDGLGGSYVPWAVPTLDGSGLYYSTWETTGDLRLKAEGEVAAIPRIRFVDAESGIDSLYREGAYAPTVSHDGRVAFVEDLDGAYHAHVENPNRVIVVASDGVSEEMWAISDEESRYVTIGWAGDKVIAYKTQQGGDPIVVALGGLQDATILSDEGSVAAISPDGRTVLLIEDGPAGVATLLVVATTSGERLAAETFSTERGPLASQYGGQWLENQIIVSGGLGDGMSKPYVLGYAVMKFDGGQLTLERFVTLPLIEGIISVESPRFAPNAKTWVRITTLDAEHNAYRGQDLLCSENGASCQPAAEPVDHALVPPLSGNFSGGQR